MNTTKRPQRLHLARHMLQHQKDEFESTSIYISLAVLLGASLYFLSDLYVDFVVEGKSIGHLLLEGGVFFAMVTALTLEISRVLRLSSRVAANEEQILRLKSHLHDIIATEFKSWNLSAAEKEIAILLIKGLSMQEIASVRGVKEKSVRQAASNIYMKANVGNRSELTSYFIEVLLTDPVRTRKPERATVHS